MHMPKRVEGSEKPPPSWMLLTRVGNYAWEFVQSLHVARYNRATNIAHTNFLRQFGYVRGATAQVISSNLNEHNVGSRNKIGKLT